MRTTGARASAVVRCLLVAMLVVAGTAWGGGLAQADPAYNQWVVWDKAVGRADCRPGDRVETGIQGEVPLEDRKSRRSTKGYNCNIDLVGQDQGDGAGIVSPSYKNCSYISTSFPTNLVGGRGPGVRVIDNSDPKKPRQTAVLNELAMVTGTWESLKVNEKRGLLVGTSVPAPPGMGFGYLSIYDISKDCTRPRLLNPGAGTNLGMPIPITTHEGAFSPDGKTYWASGAVGGHLSAVDITDPSRPMVVWSGITGIEGHGVGISPDGRQLYASTLAGITVIDVSAVQDRKPRTVVTAPVPHVGRQFWLDGQLTQHSIYVTYGGEPYVYVVDETGSGGVKLMSLRDLSALRLRNQIKLEINLPKNATRWASSATATSVFGYDAHYCTVDREKDPRAMACGWIQSGIRVFDIRDPDRIREIAYFNPPAQTGKNLQLPNSFHATLLSIAAPPVLGTFAVARAILQGQASPNGLFNDQSRLLGADLSADWCMSPPEFRGNDLMVSCMDNGFMRLRIDPTVYPPRG
ncbi:LVIVD repeat-containing protein [Tsukamurella paurometabola]|uniref:40-residue YVTN family beta-propeller repeat protein n=1 Tax=Tsukamurella paurometabola TaxID=2061 RepID=A0ABS5NGE8_TSUPA|nr:hypothetical protein [Tsukamurella paurometabola]MBS4103365.1 hypothetical protein [Tsukamurella paurometabola]